MTDSQAKTIGVELCHILGINPDNYRHGIPTSYGTKSTTGIGRMLAGLVDKHRPISVVVEILGGCLSEVWSDTVINCTLYDWDSIGEWVDDTNPVISEYSERVANMQSVAIG